MNAGTKLSLTRKHVTHLCGDLADWKVAAILKSGASAKDVELALAWAAGESDIAGEARLPLKDNAAEVYEILVGDEESWLGDRQ